MPELEARVALRPLEARLREYLASIDASLTRLSHGQEGVLARVPAWCLSGRHVRLAANRDGRGVLVRVVPTAEVAEDLVTFEEVETSAQVSAFIAPWKTDLHPSRLSVTPFALFGPMRLTLVGDPMAPPIEDAGEMIGFGRRADAESMFSEDRAKQDAIEMWNSVVHTLPQNGSFISVARGVFVRFAASIRQKSFRERRIHRLLRDHPRLLLPAHKKLFFEHWLYLDEEARKADFILEREIGLPALLVELEAPVHRILRKDGGLTAEATHARDQIAEWVSFIDQDAQRNAGGEMNFLAGPKQRLVVIGRGVEDQATLLRQRFTDTSFWTYDLLLQQARLRWNDLFAEQCRQVGRPELRPF